MPVLVIGASRGIGFELCRQLHAAGLPVVASARKPCAELTALRLDQVIDNLDITQPGAPQAAADALGNRKLRWIIHNAGILEPDSWETLDAASVQRQFEVNALGPLRMLRHLAGRVADDGKIGLVTSRVGSLGDNSSGNNYGYRMSKAAANMLGVNLAHDLRERGIAVALLHPGLVATEMTGGRGIPPAAAAAGLIARMHSLTLEDTGRFWHADGSPLPW